MAQTRNIWAFLELQTMGKCCTRRSFQFSWGFWGAVNSIFPSRSRMKPCCRPRVWIPGTFHDFIFKTSFFNADCILFSVQFNSTTVYQLKTFLNSFNRTVGPFWWFSNLPLDKSLFLSDNARCRSIVSTTVQLSFRICSST